ncbi:MAG: type II toxin-antitoxin system HicA family toxin, partial [Elusimicrobiota bacterium]
MPGLKPLPPARLIRVFKRLGYVVTKRGAGDHIIMRKDGAPRPLVIPDYRELPIFIIRN